MRESEIDDTAESDGPQDHVDHRYSMTSNQQFEYMSQKMRDDRPLGRRRSMASINGRSSWAMDRE